ncbi:MAG TPA: protein kinase [Polyangiaceae bacterium]|nr:protein kinase [Polyangiaceae bacterium]
MTHPLDDAVPEGTTFGRYAVVRRIAEGGMATVYEARHLDLMKRVALKLLHRAYASDPTLVQRFVLEARAASRLQHPHVVGVMDFGLEAGRPYMVLDLLEGDDLAMALAKGGPLPLPRLADVVLPIVSAVAAAHAEGILHRDLKPDNVFLTRRHGREHPMLLDFGISRALPGTPGSGRTLTRAGESVGTPFYMSPEHVSGERDLDGRTDQYAIGVLLYQCATGTLPYEAPTMFALLAKIVAGGAPSPSTRRPGIVPELDAVILRAMALSRNDRFPTMRELGRALWPLASPVAQAIWSEEFGDPEEIAARLSPPPTAERRAIAPRAPDLTVKPDELRRFEPFEALTSDALAGFLEATRARVYPPGATIVQQGARGHGCFLVLSGESDVVKTTSSGRWVLGRLPPGSIFGQISLVDHVPRTASVLAVGEVRVVEIDRGAFERMLLDTHPVAQALREQIAVSGIRQLRRATVRLAQLVDGRIGTDARRDLVYLQAAAHEWALPIETDEDTARVPPSR